MEIEMEIVNIKKAIRQIALTVAYSEARANKANDRIEGQFEKQVEAYLRQIETTLTIM